MSLPAKAKPNGAAPALSEIEGVIRVCASHLAGSFRKNGFIPTYAAFNLIGDPDVRGRELLVERAVQLIAEEPAGRILRERGYSEDVIEAKKLIRGRAAVIRCRSICSACWSITVTTSGPDCRTE